MIPTPAPAAETARATVVAVGDVMVHRSVERAAKRSDEGYAGLFAHVRPEIESADLAFANLETPIARTRVPRAPKVFNARAAVAEGLHQTGFDLVSVANNHIFDQGPQGLVETVRTLRAAEIVPLGAGPTCADAAATHLAVVDGIPMAWLATTELLNMPLNGRETAPCVDELDVTALSERVVAARRAGAEVVVLSVHWGDEYAVSPSPRQIEAAWALVEAGVDVILGHHTHVVQPIDKVTASDGRTGFVVYGMGNFISNQSAWYRAGVHELRHGNPRDGLLVRFHVVRRRLADAPYGSAHHTKVTALEAIPLWGLNNSVRRRPAEPLRVGPVRVGRYVDELVQEYEAEEEGPARETLATELLEMRRRTDRLRGLVGDHLAL
ncbi:MAG: CapA family protein [Myxococcales bacterium]|nr:CapA family protein [Myxococcales bacterium]